MHHRFIIGLAFVGICALFALFVLGCATPSGVDDRRTEFSLYAAPAR